MQKGLIVGVASRLGLTRAERHGGEATLGSGSLGELNLTKLLLVACDVLLQGVEQALGVLGSHDHTAEDLRGAMGSMCAKSITNSLLEWLIIARFEYSPCATSGRSSISLDLIVVVCHTAIKGF